MSCHPSILLLDDSPGECELFHLALARTKLNAVLYAEQDAEKALDLLRNRTDLPSLVLLDWRLRNQHGDAFLRRLRADAQFAAIPVVVFTTSDGTSDLASAYANGANGFVTKPDTFDELVACIDDILRYWLLRNRTVPRVETRC